MTENNLNPEKTSVPADLPHSPLIDEMQALLHKFAEENAKNKPNASDQNVQNSEEPKPQETTEDSAPERDAKSEIAELKALVAKLVEEKARNSHDDDDDDECDGNDDDFEDDYYWRPGPEWETIGYVAGGAALVGLGALLYHWMKD